MQQTASENRQSAPKLVIPRAATAFPTYSLLPKHLPRTSDAATLTGLWIVGFLLRLVRTDTVFRSLDYADLPFRVAHNWGWQWVLESPYGPMQPAITKLWAMAVTALGFAMTEPMWHVPLAVIGATTPMALYLLMRELGQDRPAALAAALCGTIAPFAVSADRYTYSAESFGLLGTALTLAAGLRHASRPTSHSAWTFGVLCAATLLSHLLFHALPAVLMYLIYSTSRAAARDGGLRAALAVARRVWLRLGVAVPPLLALLVMCASFNRTGGGQIGHLLFKNNVATTAVAAGSDIAMHSWWLTRQFGWLVACGVAGGAVFGAKRVQMGKPVGLLLVWAVVFLAPIMLLQNYYGRMYGYYLQACAALVCLACAAWWRWRRAGWLRTTSVFGLLAVAQLMLGTISTVFASDAWISVTGVCCPIGAATPDPGYRAAGWYVRTHVPADKIVYTPHAADGLEYMTASYYMGRNCLAGENLTLAQSHHLFEISEPAVDVVVAQARYDGWFNDRNGWHIVSTIYDGTTDLIRIYARNGLSLPVMQLQNSDCGREFDAWFAPRVIPTLLPDVPRLPSSREINAAAKSEPR